LCFLLSRNIPDTTVISLHRKDCIEPLVQFLQEKKKCKLRACTFLFFFYHSDKSTAPNFLGFSFLFFRFSIHNINNLVFQFFIFPTIDMTVVHTCSPSTNCVI
jgi:hypothetical protein